MPAAARTITHCGIDRERRRFRKADCMSTPTTAAWKAQQQASSAQVPDPAPDCTYKGAGELCYKTAPIYLSISGFPLLKSVAIGTHLNVHKVGRMETKQIQLALISICTCKLSVAGIKSCTTGQNESTAEEVDGSSIRAACAADSGRPLS